VGFWTQANRVQGEEGEGGRDLVQASELCENGGLGFGTVGEENSYHHLNSKMLIETATESGEW
jgi:hypothetical protein